jgi:PAS domain S-box-containing protein
VPLALTGALLAAYLHGVWMPRLEDAAEAEHLRLVERHLDSVAESLVPLLLGRQLATIHESLSTLAAKNDDWIAVALVDDRGRQLYPLPGRAPRALRPEQRPHVVERPLALEGRTLGRLTVTVDTAPGLAFGRRGGGELWALLLVLAAAIAVTLVTTLELAVLRPLRQLARAAGELAHQRFDSELPRPSRDEVGSLVSSFAGMREDLRSYHGKLLHEIAVRAEAERALRGLNVELEEREAFFRAVLVNAPAITAVLGPDRKVRFVTTSARTVLGWSEAELKALDARALVHPDDLAATEEAFRRLQGGGGDAGAVRVTCRLRRSDGSFCVMDLLASDLSGDPNVQGIVLNVRDVTAERLLQEQLLQAQKLESVGRLAGGIAHDYNNLLTVILGAAELLRADLAEGPPLRRELVEEIQEAGERTRLLTRQLLAFARRDVITSVDLDLAEVVAGSEKLLRRLLGEAVELRITAPPDLWRIRCDPGSIEQVLMNLAANARDAMPEGGRLEIELANVPGSPGAGGDRVRMIVRDTGVGMAPEVQGKLFEPFFTTKPEGKGTGLGLATVYGIVTRSGGSISVASAPGAGTSFEVLLPRLVAPGAAGASTPVPARVRLPGSETVLLVEDDRAVRETAARTLRQAGYRVLEAGDPAAALAVGTDLAVPFDLLVVDIGLPEMKGTRVAELLLRARPGLPVLFVSGHIEEAADRSEVLAAGSGFLPKPFTPAVLLDRVRRLIDERPRVTPPPASP